MVVVATLACSFGFASSSGIATAQRSVDIERFRPALDHDGFLGMQGTAVPGPWRWNTGFFLQYAKSPLSAHEEDVIAHRLAGDLQMQLGIGGRFAIALDVPMVLYQSADPAPLRDDGGAIASQAMGDPRLVARLRFYGEDFKVPRERNEGPGLAILAAVTAPLGTESAFASDGAARLELRAIGDFHIFGAGAGINVGWRHRFEERIIGRDLFRDELLFGIGIKVPIPWVEDLLALLEVRGALDARDPFSGGPQTAVEGDLGVAIQRHGVAVRTGIGTGLTGGIGTPQVRVFVGLHWAPRLADLDRDSIPDDVDQCEHLPEDFDGFEDSDGCLDPDNDMDFIPDVDDRCPNDEALEGYDEDEDGCTDPGAPVGAAGAAASSAGMTTPAASSGAPPPSGSQPASDSADADSVVEEEGVVTGGTVEPHMPSTPAPSSSAASATESVGHGTEPSGPDE